MSAPYEAFVFDMDGTLLDTIEDMKVAVNQALRQYHLPEHSREEYVTYIGNGSVKLVQRALGPDHQDLFDPVFDSYYQYYHRHFMDYTKPYPHLIEALTKAKQAGVKLFIYTNKPQAIAEELARTFFGEGFFDELVGIPLGGIVKPDPHAFWAKTKPYGFDYGKEAYFGDSGTDIETAYNIGIQAMYSVSWGYKTRTFLEHYPKPPRRILDDPIQIEDVLEGRI